VWVETPPDSNHAGEVWYEKQVTYDLEVNTAGGKQHQAHDFKARFVIRFAEVNGDSIWRIVQWADDIGQ